MKNFIKKVNSSIFLLSIFVSFKLYCQIGCMDNSKHANPCAGYDYKTYHYVHCTCPCERYAHLFDRGKCLRCGHFRKPENNFYININ